MFFESPVPFRELGIPSALSGTYQWLTRQLMVLAGIVLVVIGVAGIFLPLVPTTGPLLIASLLFAKGSPRLRQLLYTNRITGRYLSYANGTATIPVRARIAAVVWLWCGLLLGLYLLARSNYLISLVGVPYIAGGVILTVVITTFRRNELKPEEKQNGPPLENKYEPAADGKAAEGDYSYTIDSALLDEVLALSNSIHEACLIPSQAAVAGRLEDCRLRNQTRGNNAAESYAEAMKGV